MAQKLSEILAKTFQFQWLSVEMNVAWGYGMTRDCLAATSDGLGWQVIICYSICLNHTNDTANSNWKRSQISGFGNVLYTERNLID